MSLDPNLPNKEFLEKFRDLKENSSLIKELCGARNLGYLLKNNEYKALRYKTIIQGLKTSINSEYSSYFTCTLSVCSKLNAVKNDYLGNAYHPEYSQHYIEDKANYSALESFNNSLNYTAVSETPDFHNTDNIKSRNNTLDVWSALVNKYPKFKCLTKENLEEEGLVNIYGEKIADIKTELYNFLKIPDDIIFDKKFSEDPQVCFKIQAVIAVDNTTQNNVQNIEEESIGQLPLSNKASIDQQFVELVYPERKDGDNDQIYNEKIIAYNKTLGKLDSYLSVNKYNSKSNNELLDNFVKVYSPGGNSRLDCLHGQSIIPINDKYDSLYSVRDNSKVILKQEFYGVTGKSESMHAVTTVQGYNTFSSNAQSLEKDLFSRHPDVLRINHNKREMEVVTGCSTPTRYYMHTIGSYQCENSQLAINNAKTLLEQCLSENLSSSHQLSKADEPVFVLDFKPLKRILLQHDIKVFDRHTDTMKKAMDSLIHGSENGDKFKNHSYFSVWGNSYKMRMKEAPSSNKELYDKVITWLEKTNSSNNDNYSPQLASLIRELKRLTGDIANQWHSVNKLW